MKSITLTRREIFDLAKACGVIPWVAKFEDHNLNDEDSDTEYAIETHDGNPCVSIGDNGDKTYYRSRAYLDEYPQEGCWPLGEPVPIP